MKTTIRLLGILFFLSSYQMVLAQKSIRDYVNKNGSDKIKKSVLMDAFTKPAKAKSFKDGHGKNPYFTSKDQLPDTVALITFNISDLGATTITKTEGPYYTTIYTDNYNVGEKNGNIIANKIHSQSINSLKEEFKKHGVVLLTPSEYLNTPEKKAAYQKFTSVVSKLGKFLSNIENRNTDLSVCANSYRYFDLAAAFDALRSESLGYDLTKILGVDAVLSIGVIIQTNKKEGYFRSVKIALHGPNPNPKMDKKYIGQKTGNGYNKGQLYVGGTFSLKNPIKFMEYSKKTIEVDGIDIIFNSMIQRFYDEINATIQ